MGSRLVWAPAPGAPRAPWATTFAAARRPLPDVEDHPRPRAHRPPRKAQAVLAGVRRPRDRPRGADDVRDDGPPGVGGDARPERRHPEQPPVPPDAPPPARAHPEHT